LSKELSTWRITSSHSILDLKLRTVWDYRDLLLLLVRRDFISFYKQTILGPLWFFVQPLLTTLMFTLVFSRMGGFSTDGLPGPLFYLAGITAWNYFADCITKTSTVFKDNANIFGKVYFPRLIMPLSIVVSSLVRFGVQFLLFLLALVFYYFTTPNIHPNALVALFPLLVIMMGLLGLGLGMIISAMTTKYRDLAFLLTFGVQLLMYGTTVIYPLSSISEKYKWLIILNPMTPIIETFRYAFLGKGSFHWGALGYSAVVTFIFLAIGTIIFNKVEKTFIDTV
jgi:lipopolysaccharide transport system permease protein